MLADPFKELLVEEVVVGVRNAVIGRRDSQLVKALQGPAVDYVA